MFPVLCKQLQQSKVIHSRSVKTWGHYATSWKVSGSIPDEVIEFFSMYLILQAALGPGVYSASNRHEHHEFSWGVKAGWCMKADNLTAICEPTV
jgi:hypothetical protein